MLLWIFNRIGGSGMDLRSKARVNHLRSSILTNTFLHVIIIIVVVVLNKYKILIL